MLFRLSSPVLVLVVSIVIIGSTVLGFLLGRALDRRREGLREPLGVTQGALVGFVALLLAFGLTMAVGRYESRRAAVVTEANAIGTTYLRAQTLTEPERSESLALIEQYTDLRIRLDHEVPGSKQFDETSDASQKIQNQLWALAGDALNAVAGRQRAPRLYVETLNDMIDAHTTRVSALDNRIPTSVWLLQIVATAVALAVLAMYVAMLGRGVLTVFLAAALITIVVLVMFDLDRPSRGFIRVPATPSSRSGTRWISLRRQLHRARDARASSLGRDDVEVVERDCRQRPGPGARHVDEHAEVARALQRGRGRVRRGQQPTRRLGRA